MLKKIFVLTTFSALLAFAQTPTQTAMNAPTQPAMPDGQIAKVLMTINEGEIDAAKWAAEHADHKEVKKFAKDMKSGHEKNLKQTKDIAKKQKYSLDDSALSKSIADEALTSNTNLKTHKEGALDKVYITQQITMHKNALSHLDNTLIPNAASPELKKHLQKTREDVAKHLSHAESIQTKIQVTG